MTEPEAPPDNNAAERSLRPAVISRKISGGTRSVRGTDTKMTLASTLSLPADKCSLPLKSELLLWLPSFAVAQYNPRRLSRATKQIKGKTMRFRIAGHEISLDQGMVCHRLQTVAPERIYVHYVVIEERRYPVKQAFEAVTGLDHRTSPRKMLEESSGVWASSAVANDIPKLSPLRSSGAGVHPAAGRR